MTTEPTSDPVLPDESVGRDQLSLDFEEPHVVIDLRPRLDQVPPDDHDSSRYSRFIKPLFDRISGLILCLIWLPFLAILVVTIWLSMGTPAIYTQRRVGKNGTPFTMFKLRTMNADRRVAQRGFDGPDRRQVHKSPRDPRITRLGRFLRSWSLDETPQFFNVLMGQMSLVGPRPELVEIVEDKYEDWQHARHRVKPGVTGLWQISEQREALMYQATEIDLAYLRRISFWQDLRILALTIPAALGRRQRV